MTFHFCNIELLKEYIGTCGEYFGYMKKPFADIPFKQMWGCKQDDWETALRQWGIFQFFVCVGSNILANIIYMAMAPEAAGSAIFNIIYNIAIGYLTAHISWFAAIKKQGCLCCCCCLCFTDAPILLAIWGAWCCLWGVLTILTSLSYIGLWDGVGFLYTLMYLLYGVTMVYTGVCLIRIWKSKGGQVVPEKVEVQSSVVPQQQAMTK